MTRISKPNTAKIANIIVIIIIFIIIIFITIINFVIVIVISRSKIVKNITSIDLPQMCDNAAAVDFENEDGFGVLAEKVLIKEQFQNSTANQRIW